MLTRRTADLIEAGEVQTSREEFRKFTSQLKQEKAQDSGVLREIADSLKKLLLRPVPKLPTPQIYQPEIKVTSPEVKVSVPPANITVQPPEVIVQPERRPSKWKFTIERDFGKIKSITATAQE